jgi:predicted Ser/Thr protein kinase
MMIENKEIKTPMDPEKFGRYEIKKEIGRGGMATVYHAYDPRFERDVAIKVLPHAFLHDPQFRVRFEREAKMIALLEHPAIVPVYDFGEESEQPYIVMRYMSGGSLSDRIKQGPLSVEEASLIITRLAPALDAAHARGIIHRDMKPGNILFDQYGNAFISDFGIARLEGSSGGATLTQGVILGTPAYMSPEQIQGNELDGRSDLYALGVILYEMLSGVQPYLSETPGKVMMMHILEPVPEIIKVKPDMPASINAVIEKAMAKDPNQRYSTAAELGAALEAAVRGEAGDTHFVTQSTRFSPQADGTVVSRPISQSSARANYAPSTAAPATPLAPAPAAKRRLPAWAWIIGILVVLGLGAAVVLGGIAIFVNPGLLAGAATATSTKAAIANNPTATQVKIIPPTATATVTLVQPTLAPESPTIPSISFVITATPTLTPTTEVKTQAIGGADKVAFINANDIWVMNIDGSQLVQLTNDRAEKTYLRWTPDGNSVVYLSGKCIKMVDAAEGRVDSINCFEAADSVTAFEISPDGKQVAIVIDYQLFLVPYDLTALQQVKSRNGLTPLAVCKDNMPLSNLIYQSVRWSSDGAKLAVNFKGNDNGRRVDMIRIMDVSKCSSNPARLGEFPGEWFTMSGYSSNPVIPNFSWNGDLLFVLNSFERNGGFGDLYVYNTDLHKLQTNTPDKDSIDPIDGVCCYRSPTWSPDGHYLMFVFQDIRQGENSAIQLYYVPFGDIGTGASFTPISMPNTFFKKATENPEPALRPAK